MPANHHVEDVILVGKVEMCTPISSPHQERSLHLSDVVSTSKKIDVNSTLTSRKWNCFLAGRDAIHLVNNVVIITFLTSLTTSTLTL